MDAEARLLLSRLIRSQRTAALGTLRNGSPLVSMVAYAPTPDLSGFWLHLSSMALHTKGIAANPQVGLLISEPDRSDVDPQTLARISIQGRASAADRESDAYSLGRTLYLERFPDAERNFGLGDFHLYFLAPEWSRFVAGFGVIMTVSPEELMEAGRET